MKVAKRIEIELLSKSFMKRIPVVQNDRGRVLECHVTDCKIPEGTKVKFWAQKPSKKLIYNDCTVKDNVVAIELTNQALAERGTVMCQLEFDGDVSSYEFALDVDRDLSGNGVESENESTVLDALLKDLRDAIAETETSTQKADAAAEEAKDAAEEARFAAQEVDAPIKEVKGSYITADGTSQGSAIIKEIPGGTKQVKTNGYQLFDASKLPTKSASGATVTNNGDGSFTIKGTEFNGVFLTEYMIKDKAMISALFKNGKIYSRPMKINPAFYIYGYDADKNVVFTTSTSNSEDEIEDVSKIDEIHIVFYGYTGVITNGTYKPMIYQDGDGTWEPFSGGKPSPSPEYPQEIEAIGKEDSGKYVVEVKSTGKNIFDFESALKKAKNAYEKISNNEFKVKNIGNFCNKPFRILDEDRTVTLSGTVKDIDPGSLWRLELLNMKNEVVCTTSTSIKSGRGSKIRMNYSAAGQGGLFKDIQVEIGAEQTPFQPYKESTASIQLDSPLYEGDYIYLENGELWEYRENARVVFDGSEDENWGEYKTESRSLSFLYYLPNVQLDIDKAKILCNKYMHEKGSYTESFNNAFGIFSKAMSNVDSVYFRPPNPDVQTVEQWKEWLKQNPLEVVYNLVTPTRKKLGSAEAFNLRTFDGVTYIEVVGSKELGTENTFIVPRNQSGGIMTDAFATAKRNEINMAEQENLVSRIQALEKLAVKEG